LPPRRCERAGWRRSAARTCRDGSRRRGFAGGADDILYGNDWFRLRDGEALVVCCDVPDARYWAFQLCDSWFRSLDYANHQTSLNGAQLRLDADGRVRVVVASRDPGVANWLDTCGASRGHPPVPLRLDPQRAGAARAHRALRRHPRGVAR
jgi:hypothetical protein